MKISFIIDLPQVGVSFGHRKKIRKPEREARESHSFLGEIRGTFRKSNSLNNHVSKVNKRVNSRDDALMF